MRRFGLQCRALSHAGKLAPSCPPTTTTPSATPAAAGSPHQPPESHLIIPHSHSHCWAGGVSHHEVRRSFSTLAHLHNIIYASHGEGDISFTFDTAAASADQPMGEARVKVFWARREVPQSQGEGSDITNKKSSSSSSSSAAKNKNLQQKKAKGKKKSNVKVMNGQSVAGDGNQCVDTGLQELATVKGAADSTLVERALMSAIENVMLQQQVVEAEKNTRIKSSRSSRTNGGKQTADSPSSHQPLVCLPDPSLHPYLCGPATRNMQEENKIRDATLSPSLHSKYGAKGYKEYLQQCCDYRTGVGSDFKYITLPGSPLRKLGVAGLPKLGILSGVAKHTTLEVMSHLELLRKTYRKLRSMPEFPNGRSDEVNDEESHFKTLMPETMDGEKDFSTLTATLFGDDRSQQCFQVRYYISGIKTQTPPSIGGARYRIVRTSLVYDYKYSNQYQAPNQDKTAVEIGYGESTIPVEEESSGGSSGGGGKEQIPSITGKASPDSPSSPPAKLRRLVRGEGGWEEASKIMYQSAAHYLLPSFFPVPDTIKVSDLRGGGGGEGGGEEVPLKEGDNEEDFQLEYPVLPSGFHPISLVLPQQLPVVNGTKTKEALLRKEKKEKQKQLPQSQSSFSIDARCDAKIVSMLNLEMMHVYLRRRENTTTGLHRGWAAMVVAKVHGKQQCFVGTAGTTSPLPYQAIWDAKMELAKVVEGKDKKNLDPRHHHPSTTTNDGKKSIASTLHATRQFYLNKPEIKAKHIFEPRNFDPYKTWKEKADVEKEEGGGGANNTTGDIVEEEDSRGYIVAAGVVPPTTATSTADNQLSAELIREILSIVHGLEGVKYFYTKKEPVSHRVRAKAEASLGPFRHFIVAAASGFQSRRDAIGRLVSSLFFPLATSEYVKLLPPGVILEKITAQGQSFNMSLAVGSKSVVVKKLEKKRGKRSDNSSSIAEKKVTPTEDSKPVASLEAPLPPLPEGFLDGDDDGEIESNELFNVVLKDIDNQRAMEAKEKGKTELIAPAPKRSSLELLLREIMKTSSNSHLRIEQNTISGGFYTRLYEMPTDATTGVPLPAKERQIHYETANRPGAALNQACLKVLKAHHNEALTAAVKENPTLVESMMDSDSS